MNRNIPDIWRGMDQDFGMVSPLFRQLNSLFNETLTAPFRDGGDWFQSLTPACDLEEKDDCYVINFDMPGINKENIDVEVRGNTLFVKGERQNERGSDESGSQRRITERRYKQFQRAITLPDDIASDQIEADYKDGVLRVVAAKSEEAKPHKIKLGSGKGGIMGRLLGKVKDEDSVVDVKPNEQNTAQRPEAH